MAVGQTKRDAIADSQKWESAIAFVQAGSALRMAIKDHGLMSPEVKLAQHRADAALSRYKKWRVK